MRFFHLAFRAKLLSQVFPRIPVHVLCSESFGFVTSITAAIMLTRTVCLSGQRGGPCGLTANDKIPFTLSQLVVFRTVAVTGSGSAAALALSVSQPAISKSLSLLEQVRHLFRREACSPA